MSISFIMKPVTARLSIRAIRTRTIAPPWGYGLHREDPAVRIVARRYDVSPDGALEKKRLKRGMARADKAQTTRKLTSTPAV